MDTGTWLEYSVIIYAGAIDIGFLIWLTLVAGDALLSAFHRKRRDTTSAKPPRSE